MVSENESIFGDAIFAYTRAQAINDGVLVDLTQFKITKLSWKMHVACTDSVFTLMETAVNEDGKDYDGILHDMYFMARIAITNTKRSNIINFRVIIGKKTVELKMIVGPGDDLTPVLTIMLPNED